MKSRFTDALQVFTAIVITGSTAFVMQPPAQQQMSHQESVKSVQVVSEPVVAVQEAPTEPQKPVEQTQTIAPTPEPEPTPVAAPTPTVAPEAIRSAARFSGDKNTWLVASGIPESEWWAVDYIVSRESGWNPCAYNPGKSDCNANPTSACGLAQSYPCGKVPGHWTDPVANLKWQYDYVKARYGGYAGAVKHWQAYKSY